MHRSVPLSIVLTCAACGAEGFPSPWEGSPLSTETISATFRAYVGEETPGMGSYSTPNDQARDGARVQVLQVERATWPVVQVQVFGRGEQGLNVLELDVSLDRWVAGEVQVDGTSAVGAFTLADGQLRYVVGGVLRLEAAGLEAGQIAAGVLEEASLTEVVP